MSKTTPQYGLPYPENADTPDLGYWNQQLAQAVEAALPLIQYGTQNITLANGSWGSVNVAFAKPYAAAPVVTAVAAADGSKGGPFVASVYNVSTTGFTLAVGPRDAALISGTWLCQWQAIGK